MDSVWSGSCKRCYATNEHACLEPCVARIQMALCSSKELHTASIQACRGSAAFMMRCPCPFTHGREAVGNNFRHILTSGSSFHMHLHPQEGGNGHRRSARRHSVSRPHSRISGSMPRRFSTSAAIVLVSAASSSSLSWPSALSTSPFSAATGTARSSTSNCGALAFSRPLSALR